MGTDKERRPMLTDSQREVKNEICKALERLGAEPPLLATVSSWGDTLTDGEVLRSLREFNAGRPILHHIQ